MCGIAGIWKFSGEKVNVNELKTFTDSLSHRGPDGSGYWINDRNELGLGHRRLSILDTSENGAQPMHSNDGEFVIVYNGEIFNFLELKKELSNFYSFKTNTDTEIILAAYKHWGEKCVTKFNGMWALAIYNVKTKSLFLCRDRWGIKPLYYLFDKNKFCFASETIAFRQLENYKREIDPELMKRAIAGFESLEGYGYTVFSNINCILPGHFMKIENGKVSKQQKWWDTRKNLIKVPDNYEDQKREFFRLFKEACILRLRSDVSVGTALSGGVDSSAVYCMLKYLEKHEKNLERLPSDWQRAFIATFPGEKTDEKKYADLVLDYTNKKGNFIEVNTSNLSDNIYRSTFLFDSIADSPIYGVSNIYQGMRDNGIRVSLDGHGVDEMMYGYKMLVKKLALSAYQDKERFSDIKQTYKDLFFPEEQEQQLRNLEESLDRTSAKKNNVLSSFKKQLKRSIGYNKLTPISGRQFLNVFAKTSFPILSDEQDDYSDLNEAQKLTYNTFHTTTLPTILRNFDRASMQSSIEVRMPFMDYKLVGYIFSLPETSLIGSGYTKKILRDSLSEIMPREIVERKLKLGFPMPLETWIKKDCRDMFMDIASSTSFTDSTIWEGKNILKWAENNYRNDLWSSENINLFWVYINAHIISKN